MASIPGLDQLFKCNPVNLQSGCIGSPVPKISGAQNFTNLGDLVTGILNVTFTIAFFLTFIWMFWGAFEYIFAGGEKDKLAHARGRIISALIGLVILALAFAIAQIAENILAPQQTSPISLIQTAYAADPTFPCGKDSPGGVITPCPTPADISTRYPFGNVKSLGEGLNHLAGPAFSLAGIMVTIYFIYGAFTYLTSGGSKEAIEKAQGMIVHSIIGFLILMLIFFVMQYLPAAIGIKFSLF